MKKREREKEREDREKSSGLSSCETDKVQSLCSKHEKTGKKSIKQQSTVDSRQPQLTSD